MDDEQLITGIACSAGIRNWDVISRDPERGRIVMITIVSTAHYLFLFARRLLIQSNVGLVREEYWNRRARAASYIRS